MATDVDASSDRPDDTNGTITSSKDDVISEGLNSRTQSYTSVASSQVSRGSKLPDYDFAEDDRPGKYQGSKKEKTKKDVGKKEKKTEKVKDKQKKEKGAKKVKNGKDKQKKPKKDNEKEKEKSGKLVKKNDQKTKTGKENDAFQKELESAVNQREKSESASSVDADTTSQASKSGDVSGTSKRGSKKDKKSKKKPVKVKKRGRSKTKIKKRRSLSKASSQSSFTDVTTDCDDVFTDDDTKNNEKNSKKNKKKKGNKKKGKSSKAGYDAPVVVVINDDTDDELDPAEKKKTFLGICPVPSKTEPLVYNCCMCCSLGAGSLITGIIYVLFSIGFLVIRAQEFKKRTVIGIWLGKRLLPDVWRLFLIVGFMTAGLCLLASLLLVVASCLWGNKERYNRIRRVVAFWFIATVTAVINNIGEAIFVQTMPNIKFEGFTHSSDSIEDIKSNNVQLWALTGLHTLLFAYITLVLISYLRLLKYMDSPKIGTAPKPAPAASGPVKATSTDAPKPVKRKRRASLRSTRSETKVKLVSEVDRRPPDDEKPDIPLRRSNTERRRPRRGTDDYGDRIYMNTGSINDDAEGSLSRATSELSLTAPSLPSLKNESFKDVLEDLADDTAVFENMSKPKPLKRMPVGRPRPSPLQEAIYVNHAPLPVTPRASYSTVSKPLKRASSFSDVKSPVYDSPPTDADFKQLLEKRNDNEAKDARYGSEDTGFNSRSSIASSVASHPDIGEMERLAEELRQKQEALDKSGNCDPATAENLTQMALNALKLSEKILQDVKSNGSSRLTSFTAQEESNKPEFQQNLRLATSFFDELSRDPNAMTENPIEEMFRMYGKDLCSQNPEMVDRYLLSYKALQDHKTRQQMNIPPETRIAETALNEQKPWRSILNPSEAIPAVQTMSPNPLLSSLSQNSMGTFSGEDSRLTQNPFSPSQPMSQPFHSVSHAQSGPPPPNSFFPLEYPPQNSASYNPEPQPIGGPQNAMVPYKPPQFDQNFPKGFPPKGGYPHNNKGPPHDEYYYDEECPYSCCYTMYDDYGSIYGDYGPYPPHYMGSDTMYGENGMYTGPNWFPMGDPAYSIDPYYNPYEVWDEPAPPYTERSTGNSLRTGATSSRGYDSKAGTSSKGYSSKPGSSGRASDSRYGASSRGYSGSSKGYSGRTSSRASASRGYTYRSRSLPNLLDDDLYSERSMSDRQSSKSIHNLARWGIDNEDIRDTIGRPSSRQSKSLSRPSSAFEETTRDAFMKGYKAALKEALMTISAKKDGKNSRRESRISDQDDFIEKLISQVGDKERSKSPDRSFSSREIKIPRTISSDSRMSSGSRRFSRDGRKVSHNSGKESRNFSRASSGGKTSRNMSRIESRESDVCEKLSSALSRRTSKLSFRPASRPGQPLFDDYYDDYRSTSSVPPTRDELDDFGFPRRKSSQNSVGFKSLKSSTSRNSEQSEDILSTFELMSSHGGRPSTRSRLSSRNSQRTKEIVPYNGQDSSATYPYSENESHFYNKLDLDRAFSTQPARIEPEPQRGRTQDRVRSRDERSRSQSANGRRQSVDLKEEVTNERSGSANGARRNNKEVLWFMGDDDRDPIYSSEYEGVWTLDSGNADNRPRPSLQRSSSYPAQPRLDSVGSSKRKSVTFDKRPKIKEVNCRRTSWN